MASSVQPVSTTSLNLPILLDRSISSEERQKLISSLSAEQIHSMAKLITNYFMNEILNIDVPRPEISRFALDGKDGSFVGWVTKSVEIAETEKRKQFVEALVPVLTKQLTEAFSLPAQFCEKGVSFCLYDRKGSGLINNPKTTESIDYAEKVLENYFEVSQRTWHSNQLNYTFKLDESKPQYVDDFYFSLYGPYSHMGWTLKRITETV